MKTVEIDALSGLRITNVIPRIEDLNAMNHRTLADEINLLRISSGNQIVTSLVKKGYDKLLKRYPREYDSYVGHLVRETALNGVPISNSTTKQKDTTMDKKDSKKKEDQKKSALAPEPEVVETAQEAAAPVAGEPGMTYLEAYKIFSQRMWPDEADQPDFSEMDEATAEQELRDNISLLTPEDEDEIINEAGDVDGPAAWAIFLSIREDLFEEAKTVVEAKNSKLKKEKTKKEPKEKKERGPQKEKGVGVIKAIEECLVASGKDGISKEDILHKLQEKFPGRSSDSMKATINVQIPSRMKKEKKLDIQTKKIDGHTTLYFIN